MPGAGWKARAQTNWVLQIHFLFFLFGVLISDAGDSDLDDGRGDVVASAPIRIVLAVLRAYSKADSLRPR